MATNLNALVAGSIPASPTTKNLCHHPAILAGIEWLLRGVTYSQSQKYLAQRPVITRSLRRRDLQPKPW